MLAHLWRRWVYLHKETSEGYWRGVLEMSNGNNTALLLLGFSIGVTKIGQPEVDLQNPDKDFIALQLGKWSWKETKVAWQAREGAH